MELKLSQNQKEKQNLTREFILLNIILKKEKIKKILKQKKKNNINE